MGSKYFKDIGYDNLFKAALLSKPFNSVIWARSPYTNKYIPRKQLYKKDFTLDKIFSSPDRLKKFQEDITFFTKNAHLNWQKLFSDFGLNVTPFWATAAGILANIAPASKTSFKMLAWIDRVLLISAFIIFGFTFGVNPVLLGIIFWATTAINHPGYISGAFLRLDWFFFLACGFYTLKRKAYLFSGGFFTLSILSRLFPALYTVMLSIYFIVSYRKRQLKLTAFKFILGSMLVLIVATSISILYGGADKFSTYYNRIGLYGKTILANNIGFRQIIVNPYIKKEGATLKKTPTTWNFLRSKASQHWSRFKFLHLSIIGVYILFFIFYIYKLKFEDTFLPIFLAESTLMFFILFNPNSYYLIYLSILVFALKYNDNIFNTFLLISLFALNIIENIFFLRGGELLWDGSYCYSLLLICWAFLWIITRAYTLINNKINYTPNNIF